MSLCKTGLKLDFLCFKYFPRRSVCFPFCNFSETKSFLLHIKFLFKCITLVLHRYFKLNFYFLSMILCIMQESFQFHSAEKMLHCKIDGKDLAGSKLKCRLKCDVNWIQLRVRRALKCLEPLTRIGNDFTHPNLGRLNKVFLQIQFCSLARQPYWFEAEMLKFQ